MGRDLKADLGPGTAARATWLKTLHQWHWISSALCLVGMLLFALTGITLNHASWIETHPRVIQRNAQLPAPMLEALGGHHSGPLSEPLRSWLADTLKTSVSNADPEWTADEIYLPMPRPGGDAWLRIDRASGDIEFEDTDRGWLAYLNDLHKGRHAGMAWSWFIDLFAVACLLFSITGLLILKHHAVRRPSTWPLVGFGLVLPALLALLLIH